MRSGWGKAAKAGVISFTVLMSIIAVAYMALMQSTDLGSTLAQQEMVERKGKEYGMYSTLADIEKALSVPEQENAGPAIQAACLAISKKRKGFSNEFTLISNAFYGRSGAKSQDPTMAATPEVLAAVNKLQPMVDAFFEACQPVLGRKYCVMKRDWSAPFETHLPEYQQINLIHRVLMFDILEASLKGDEQQTIKAIERDSELRRCLANMDEWLWAYKGANISRHEAALFMLNALKTIKKPSKELVAAMRKNMSVTSHSDFKHLCRTFFYMGADGFPREDRWPNVLPDHMLTSGFKFFTKLPRVTKAYKLRIQLAAVAAYEAGLKSAGKPDVIEIANHEFEVVAITSGQSSTFVANLFGPGMSVPSPLSPIYVNIEQKLNDKLKSLGF